jgi:dihydroorotate dehydrogenase (NAD+) catalytic subunit
MSVEFCGLRLAHPIINGSGTFDLIAAHRVFGDGLIGAFPFAAYVSKTITLKPRQGNPPPRLWEPPAGLVNSIGLPNKGLDAYLSDDLPEIHQLLTHAGEQLARMHLMAAPTEPPKLITNVMGATAEEFAALIEACDPHPEIAALELNVSCPNVKTGLDIGADPNTLERVVEVARSRTTKPLIVKLTPNATDVPACGQAAEAGGADAVALINTLRAMALSPSPRSPASAPAQPWLGGRTGGLSGPAVRVVALAQVAAVAERLSIPVIGMGGVQSATHARELLDVGATLVAVGTESFRDPAVAARIALELSSSAPA